MRKRFIQKGQEGLITNYNDGNGYTIKGVTVYGNKQNRTINPLSVPSMDSSLLSTLATIPKINKTKGSKGLSEGTMNTIGDVSNIVGTIADAFPTLDKTKNTNDAYVEQARDFLYDAAFQSKNPFVMTAAGILKVVDKTGGFTDASKGLGDGLDAANAFASFALPGVGYFAPKTESMELDQRVQSSSAYSGLSTNLQEVSQNADAKLLVGHDKANSMIADAKSKQNRALGILDNADMAKFNAASNIHSIGSNLQLRGGYNSMVAAKNGAKLFNNLDDAKRILAYQKGKKVKPRYKDWVQSVNPIMLNSNYDLEKAYNNYPFEMLEAWRKDPKNNHLNSLLEIPNDDGTFDYEFLKLGTSDENPEIKYELNGYYSDPNWNVNPSTHKLEFKNGRYYYRAIPPTVRKESTIVDYFKQGGSINVIPDGALHARKHHLEEIDEKYKDVTHKGIPVISESEGGEITQHAEVEKEEIIFRLEVTQKLEELAKENTDESAIEAGKLLVEEILYNTKDNTNKLL